MPDPTTDGLILNILLSVESAPNTFPNINFLRNTSWADVQNVPDNDALGRNFFKKVSQQSYEKAQRNVSAAASADVKNDAMVLTRSVKRLTADDAGSTPWDGEPPHPDSTELAAWIGKLSQA
jgi:hypothetical protein